jgi:DNA-binding PadR family transcriptional regulator
MGETMYFNLTDSGRRRLRRQVQRQWNRIQDAALDTIAGWRDQRAGQIHATYGLTTVQAASQARTFEEIRRGYQPKITA